METELKPCPFCGSSPKFASNGEYDYIECPECDARGPGALMLENAFKGWNTRPGEDDLRRQLEQARAALSIFAASDHWGQLVIKGKRKFLWISAFDPIECAAKALKGP